MINRTYRRRLLVSALAAAVAGGASAWWLGRSGPVDHPPAEGAMAAFEFYGEPQPTPEISFQDAGGNTVTLADFAGDVVLVNLWATWCAPCVHEMPTLDRLQAAFAEDGLTVAAVSIDLNGIAAVEPFYAAQEIGALAAYADPAGSLLGGLQIAGLPTTVLFDRRGREVGRLAGDADWFSPEAQAIVRHYLGEAGSSGSAPSS